MDAGQTRPSERVGLYRRGADQVAGGLAADGDERDVADDVGSVGELEHVRPAAEAGPDALDGRFDSDLDAVGAIAVREQEADLASEQPLERRRPGFEQGHVNTESSGGGRDLGADEAGADDGEPRTGRQAAAETVGVGAGAQAVDARPIEERLQRSCAGAGCEDEHVPADRPGAGLGRALAKTEVEDAGAETKLDPALVPERSGTELEVGSRAGE